MGETLPRRPAAASRLLDGLASPPVVPGSGRVDVAASAVLLPHAGEEPEPQVELDQLRATHGDEELTLLADFLHRTTTAGQAATEALTGD